MKENKIQREIFDPENVPLKGSLGLLALGDIGFEAWRKAKGKNNLNNKNEKE